MSQPGDSSLMPIKLAGEPMFRLGDVVIHPPTRQITRHGRSETLEPRVMQVLIAFAQAEGAILSRDDLIARCWAGRVVGDNAIHRAVSKVRELGLNFSCGAFHLETITKVGYRMIVAGSDQPDLPVLTTDAAGPATASAAAPTRRVIIAAGFAGMAAVAGGAYWIATPSRSDARIAALLAASEQAMRTGLPEAGTQGIGFLEEAAALQPGNPLVLGRLALARAVATEYAAPEAVSDLSARTQDAARQALAIAPRQVDARAAMALLPPYFGDWLAAEQRMEAVLDIDPEHLPTRDALAFLRVGVGRGAEGSRDRIAFSGRDPLHAAYQFKLIYAHWVLGEIGEADRTADRALQLWPKHPGVWFARLWTLAFTGRATRALAHVEDELGRPDLPPPMVAMLRQALGALDSGQPAAADTTIASLRAMASSGPSLGITAILILSALGRIDDAFEFAEAYLLERGPLIASLRWRPGQVSVNDQRRRKTQMLFVPASAPMRRDPRFAALVEACGLTRYWEQSGTIPDHLRV